METAEHALGTATLATQDTVTVLREGIASASRREAVLFNIFTGFTGAVLFIRFSTWGIRGGWWPAGNVRVRGRHVHHFVPGIAIAFVTGGAGLVTSNERLEEVLAFPFGAGIGLTLDEAALLLQLEDVYWTPEGLLSVQISLGAAALLGSSILALRILRRGEQRSERAGLIPDLSGEYPQANSNVRAALAVVAAALAAAVRSRRRRTRRRHRCGALRAEVSANPWHLTLTDPAASGCSLSSPRPTQARADTRVPHRRRLAARHQRDLGRSHEARVLGTAWQRLTPSARSGCASAAPAPA